MNETESTPNAKDANSPPKDIGGEVDIFVNQMDSLNETLPLALLAIDDASDTSEENFMEFVDEELRTVSELDGQITYKIDVGHYSHLLRLITRMKKTQMAKELVPRSLFVSLVSQFDAYLGRLIRQLFELKPEALTSSASTLTFAQLSAFGSIDSAREYIVDKEIESVLRKSHSEQFDWLENKFGLPLRAGLEAWPIFVEVTERRNLFVHTNGVVSHQYLDVCRRNGCTPEPGTQLGKSVSVTREYFTSAYECLFEIGVKLAQVLWRKLEPGKLVNADASLNRVTYELLVEGRYRLAQNLLDFGAETLKKHGSDEGRLIILINRVQAYKWDGNCERAKAILDAEDWTARNLKFKLARAVLADDFEAALLLMGQIGANGEVNKHFYREWPLFREIRKCKKFSEAFESIFGEPFTEITVNC